MNTKRTLPPPPPKPPSKGFDCPFALLGSAAGQSTSASEIERLSGRVTRIEAWIREAAAGCEPSDGNRGVQQVCDDIAKECAEYIALSCKAQADQQQHFERLIRNVVQRKLRELMEKAKSTRLERLR